MRRRPAFFAIIVPLLLLPALSAAHDVRTWTVTIGESGFEPRELTIIQGDSITFKNTGTQEHWPASDLHPTHGIYPEFDPKRYLAPGEEWTFRFTKPGTYGMHDHLMERFTGRLTVTRDDDFAEEGPAEDIHPSTGFFEGVKIFFMKLYLGVFPGRQEAMMRETDTRALINANDDTLLTWMRLFGPDVILQDVLAETGGGTTMDCHTEAHILGRAAYRILGADAFAEGDSSCHSGYYHGAMEVMLQEEGTEDLRATVTDICRNFGTSFGVFECLHGIGHGLLATLSYDLPETVKLCQSLETSFDQSSCLGGAFMENIVQGLGIGATADHTTTWLSDDPQFPCNVMDKTDVALQRECYQMQTSWMYHLYPGNDARVAEECNRIEGIGREYCLVSYGRDAAGSTLRSPQGIVGKCALIADEADRWFCYRGGLGVIIDFWGPGLRDQASGLCKIVEGSHKGNCYQLLASRLPELFTDPVQRVAVCDTFEEPYAAECRARTNVQ